MYMYMRYHLRYICLFESGNMYHCIIFLLTVYSVMIVVACFNTNIMHLNF